MYTPNFNWHELEQELVKRQGTNGGSNNGGGFGSGSSSSDGSGDNNGFPPYVVIIIVIFFAVALGCTVCVRINQRRQRRMILDQTLYASRNGSQFDPSRPRPGFMPSLSFQAIALRPPQRARRRPSQASITDLPVYMENPGEREVVLLQTVAPKVEEGTPNQNNTSANGTPTANGTANGIANVNTNATGNSHTDGDIPARASTATPPPNPFQESHESQQPPSHIQSNNPFRASIESNFTHEQGQGTVQEHSTTNQLRPLSPLSTLPEGTEGTSRTHETTPPSAIPLPPSPSSPLSPSRQASQSAHSPNL